MSQSGVLSGAQPGTGDLLTLTGDTGGTISPDINGNINIFGSDGLVLVSGDNGTATLTISIEGRATYEFQTIGAQTGIIIVELTDLSNNVFEYTVVAATDDYQFVYSNVGSVCAFRITNVFAFNTFNNESSNFVLPNVPSFFVQSNTPNVEFNGEGVAGLTINWKVILQQTILDV